MPRQWTRSILGTMNRTRALAVGPDSIYMVETYRAAAPGADHPRTSPGPDHPTVLAVIDVPGDEVALIVMSAADAATAEQFVRDGGMRPIRVVPVQWNASSGASLDPRAPADSAR